MFLNKILLAKFLKHISSCLLVDFPLAFTNHLGLEIGI